MGIIQCNRCWADHPYHLEGKKISIVIGYSLQQVKGKGKGKGSYSNPTGTKTVPMAMLGIRNSGLGTPPLRLVS